MPSVWKNDPEKTKEARRHDRRVYYSQGYHGPNRDPWTDEEIRLVIEHPCLDSELSLKINRTMCAIQVERRKLRKSGIKIPNYASRKRVRYK